MNVTLLGVAGLSKRFQANDAPVVDALDLDVHAGEIFALLGPSGCGKTTTLRLIAGLERADRGELSLAGATLAGPGVHVPPEKRNIGLVFQDYALFPHLNVLENVLFGLRGVPTAEARSRARETLEMVKLSACADRSPGDLSGGEQQRVALARALAPAPKLLLLDEPFSNLDANLRESTRQEMRSLLKRESMTAILVTHDQREALTFADRIAVMSAGRREQVGTPEELYLSPESAFVAEFLGETNLMEVEARAGSAQTPLGTVQLDQQASGSVWISLRPEHIAINRCANSKPTGVVVGREFCGTHVRYRVDLGDRSVTAHAAPGDSFIAGEAVVLQISGGVAVVRDGSRPEQKGS